MFESNFTFTNTILEKSLNANVLRWNVISNNIANVSTPNFKRSDVKFQAQLQRALKSQQSPYPFDAKKVHQKHIPFFEKKNYKKILPKIHTEYYNTIFNNGNNIDVEHEMAESAKTVLLYEATANMLARNYQKINLLLKP